jgi:hypothetical protein
MGQKPCPTKKYNHEIQKIISIQETETDTGS